MNRFAQVLGFGLGLVVAGSALASDEVDDLDLEEARYDQADAREESPHYEWARVISVDPIIERYAEPESREVCYRAPVEVAEPRYVYEPRGYYRGHRDTTGATLAGALIGGALGNLAGKGDGRKAATLAGAVIGGSIAHDSARRDRHYYGGGYRPAGVTYRTEYERRCEERTSYRDEERVSGYDVTYEYQGRRYHTTTDAHPGSRIRVEVSVDAVDY